MGRLVLSVVLLGAAACGRQNADYVAPQDLSAPGADLLDLSATATEAGAGDLRVEIPDLPSAPDQGLGDLSAADRTVSPDQGPIDLRPADGPAGDCGALNTVDNCGACGRACGSAGTVSTACVSTMTGLLCKPVCNGTHGDCDDDPTNGCEASLLAGGMCTCDGCHTDCDGQAANGCETNFCDDADEPNGACPGGNLGALLPNHSLEQFARILPTGDLDVYHVRLTEPQGGACTGTQHYAAEIKLFNIAGLRINNRTDCGSLPQTAGSTDTDVCIAWTGNCGTDDSQTLTIEVRSDTGAHSCSLYDLQVQYYGEGATCP